MMIGHFFLAFLIAALAARALGAEKEHALNLALFAGFFAILPDLDMVYAAKELLFILDFGAEGFVDSFWSTSNEVHRGITHSLVTGVIASAGFTVYYRWSNALTALTVGFSFFLYALLLNGLVSASVVSVFVLAGLAVTWKSRDFLSLKQFVSVSLLGLLSHPFGDVFTGVPPGFLYPLNFSILESRIILFPDPVINLLSIFILEVSIAAAAVTVLLRLKDIDVSRSVNTTILLGFVYASAILYVPEPTLRRPTSLFSQQQYFLFQWP